VLHLQLIIFSVGGDVPIDNEALLMTDLMNLKIKLTQSFKCDHRNKMYVRVFIGVGARIYINIYVYTIFLKKTCLISRMRFTSQEKLKESAPDNEAQEVPADQTAPTPPPAGVVKKFLSMMDSAGAPRQNGAPRLQAPAS
jgi:hypothetical protein